MELFFASVGDTDIAKKYFDCTGVKINVLFSYYYIKDNVKEKIALQKDYVNKIMLDSGAFTLFGKPNEIETLNNKYRIFLEKNKQYVDETFCNTFSLDYMKSHEDFDDNHHAYLELRQLYPNIIPVVHQFISDEDDDEIETYLLDKPNVISIGQIESRTSEDNYPKIIASVDRIKQKCRCHLLGVTAYDVLKEVPNLDTCDSQSWLEYATKGQILFNKINSDRLFENYIVYFPRNEEFNKKGVYYKDWQYDTGDKYGDYDLFLNEIKDKLGFTLSDLTGDNVENRKICNIYYQLKMIKYINAEQSFMNGNPSKT